ncbi:tRNA (adenine-N1)-methyltransferase [Thermocrinis sp.]
MPIQEGDLVLIQTKDKRFLKRITPGFNINYGKRTLKFEQIVGKEYGSVVEDFYLLKPNLESIILYGFKRKTQIIYPKDAFYIAFKLGIDRNSTVLEFGIGSGALTAVLSQLAGKVIAYEVSQEFYRNALKNWETFGLCKNVEATNMDFSEAEVQEEFFDACFVDVREPWLYLEKVHKVLKKSATCGFLLPTTNQVSQLLKACEGLFGGIEVMEILLRRYKPVHERLRPEDIMVAHTGYLVFGMKIV